MASPLKTLASRMYKTALPDRLVREPERIGGAMELLIVAALHDHLAGMTGASSMPLEVKSIGTTR